MPPEYMLNLFWSEAEQLEELPTWHHIIEFFLGSGCIAECLDEVISEWSVLKQDAEISAVK